METEEEATLPRSPNRPDTAVWPQTEPTGGARYRTGLTVYDEALIDGRFIGRYWSATGTIVPDRHIDEEREIRSMLPSEAFRLKIDDHVLDRNWQWVAAHEEPVTPSGTHRVAVDLEQRIHPLRVKVRTRLSAGPFLVRGLEITNTADHPVALTAVAPFSGLLWWTRWYQECIPPGGDVFTLGYYKGDQPEEEGNFVWEPLQLGTKTVESRMGRSGHSRPSFMIRNEANGETFILELAWSSNWRFVVTVEHPAHAEGICLSVALGPFSSDPVLRVIGPGETISTPEVHIGHLHADLAGCVQALHRHIRSTVVPPQLPGKAHLVAANHRGYLIDRENEVGIIREIDIAAAMGAEVFVVDAGWYGPEPNRWSSNVGDWQAGAWLPNDLYPLITHAHDRGLLFGLWVEIESIGVHTALRRTHPDWVLTRDDGREVGVGRHIDAANPEVAAWMEAELTRVISQYQLDLFRLDYNSYAYEGGNRVNGNYRENTLWRHVETIWAIMERLRKKFPDVIFETCASGGGRLDLGMLRYFHITEITDWMPAPRSLKILNGIALTLPPELCLRTFGTEIQDHYLFGDIDFQLRSCLFGQPILRGIAPTLDEIGEPRRSKIIHALDLYKRWIRPILPTALVFHHTPHLPLMEPQPWCVLEYAAPDGSRETAGIFRLTGPCTGRYTYRPRGLRAGVRYRVTWDTLGDAVELSGFALRRDGIDIDLESPLTSELLLIERV
jgi:alpha-galactosidase